MPAPRSSVQRLGRSLATVGTIAVVLATAGELALGLNRIDRSLSLLLEAALERQAELRILVQAALGSVALLLGLLFILAGWLLLRLGRMAMPACRETGRGLESAA